MLSVALFASGSVFMLAKQAPGERVLGETTPSSFGLSAPSEALAVPIGPDAVRVTWQQAGSAGIRYEVFRNGKPIGVTAEKKYIDSHAVPGGTYAYAVRAVDGAGSQVSTLSNKAQVSLPVPESLPIAAPETEAKGAASEPSLKIADIIAPKPPMNLAAALNAEGKVKLSWKEAADNVGIAQYRVVRDGRLIGTTKNRTFDDDSVQSGRRYTYTVVAIDIAGNVSPASRKADAYTANELSSDVASPSPTNDTVVTTDATPPATPLGISAEVLGAHVIRVRFGLSNDNVGVANYMVYRDGKNIGLTFNTLYYDDITAVPGEQYAYFVVARDIAKNESAPSESVIAAVPIEKEESPKALIPRVSTALLVPDQEKITSDKDQDGLSDAEEDRLGTNPAVTDTDGDGFFDGDEIRAGFDPLKYSQGDKSDKITFESPQEPAIRENDSLRDTRYTVRSIERSRSEKTGQPTTKLSGTGLPNSVITVFVYSNPIVILVKTDAGGNWSYELDRDLEDGNHEVYVAVTDNIGRITATSPAVPFVKTAEAITMERAPGDGQETGGSQSPIDRLFTQYVIAGSLLAFLSIAFVVTIIIHRSGSDAHKPSDE